MRLDHAQRRSPEVLAVVGIAVFGTALLCGGCGHSASAEYARIRSIVVPAQPGDGSVVASVTPWGAQPGLAKAIASADRGRGHASDSTRAGD